MSTDISQTCISENCDSLPVQSLLVLLAEDNNILARALTLQLQKLGCEVDWVPNGAEAVSRASERDYDLLLLDNKMPVLDGVPAAIKIKGLPNLKANSKIVILTGGLEREDRERCKQAGIQLVLDKPARMQELKQVITLVKSA